jgi:hypothetical protein
MGNVHQIQTLELILEIAIAMDVQVRFSAEGSHIPLQVLDLLKCNLSTPEITMSIFAQYPLQGGHHEHQDHGVANPFLGVEMEQRYGK